LRKVLAKRVSIADAAKVGGAKVEDFYKVLKPLGFESETIIFEENNKVKTEYKTSDMDINSIDPGKLTELDVRDEIADRSGEEIPDYAKKYSRD